MMTEKFRYSEMKSYYEENIQKPTVDTTTNHFALIIIGF